jgi:nucleotide-binding universal stress UspA family protein
MKVLIATDGSKEATTALRTANRLLSPMDRNLDLLCVGPKLPNKNWNRARRNGYEQRLLGEITQVLEQARGHLPSDAGVIKLLPEIGSPSAAIVNKAGDYDLIVIGPRGNGTTGEGGLGPVASRVVEHALGPVLVARELRSGGDTRVLVAVDGSTAALHAVETLRSLFDLSSTEICLMHVAETPWIQLGPEEDWATYSDEDKDNSEAGVLEKELVREGEEALEQARDLLRSLRLSVSTRVDEGNPANEILSEAERGQYDLIVVGATGSRDLKHDMLGSVSSKIAWNAPCSVLIAREEE